MIRFGALFWLVLVSATGFAMFGVKYQVQALEDELARTRRATMTEEHEIRVLEAEWAYLTRPETLDTMNRRFLSLAPILTKQLHTTVADIPMRPPPPAPPPVAEPVETAVATAEPSPPTPQPAEGPEEAPSSLPARQPVNPTAEPPPTRSALHAMPALLDKPAPSAQLAKAAPVKAAPKPATPRRAKSLDDLIAQIMTSR
jgi:cell division protein FtsL